MSISQSSETDSISVYDLAEWRRANTKHMILDVREADELSICAIPAATHIPMAKVPSGLQALPRDMPVVVMCHHGMRSMRVVNFLRQAGYANAVNLDGGINAWAEQIDPAMPRY